ncbi:MAG: HNH endonuclease signature motif containing protein [Dokdonella sp.]
MLFRTQLRDEAMHIPSDLFPNLASVGLARTGDSLRGYYFELLLADRRSVPADRKKLNVAVRNASTIVQAAWHLFACLYPWEPIAVRRAGLRRAMAGTLGVGACEYRSISNTPASRCDDTQVQAAHIVPYALGGNDRPWNGLWLCEKHHRETEGKISGRRDPSNLSRVTVRFDG